MKESKQKQNDRVMDWLKFYQNYSYFNNNKNNYEIRVIKQGKRWFYG